MARKVKDAADLGMPLAVKRHPGWGKHVENLHTGHVPKAHSRTYKRISRKSRTR